MYRTPASKPGSVKRAEPPLELQPAEYSSITRELSSSRLSPALSGPTCRNTASFVIPPAAGFCRERTARH